MAEGGEEEEKDLVKKFTAMAVERSLCQPEYPTTVVSDDSRPKKKKPTTFCHVATLPTSCQPFFFFSHNQIS